MTIFINKNFVSISSEMDADHMIGGGVPIPMISGGGGDAPRRVAKNMIGGVTA